MLKRLTRPELSGIWLVDSASTGGVSSNERRRASASIGSSSSSSMFPGGNAGEGTEEEFKVILTTLKRS